MKLGPYHRCSQAACIYYHEVDCCCYCCCCCCCLLLTRAARCALRRPNQRSCHISACLHRPLSLQQSRQAVICLLQRLGLRWVSRLGRLGHWDTGSIQRSRLASKKEHIVAFSVGLGFFFLFVLPISNCPPSRPSVPFLGGAFRTG
ncbi:hypothetical protein BP00DRAFT_197676 [Aspergillus indologenus CBS 114.80]|uniref:Uncharacterized protein n=1 Tax=Aspergillus indologenus CBS 114.80 TaxID=1450541 RepID=A0A2V5I1N6_9EURO|nr:hypothetical protein BP00DRAFT_197676 [Aspergillus indologenus CBS 114.80]